MQGVFKICSALNPNLVFDCAEGKTGNGTRIFLWNWHGGESQLWRWNGKCIVNIKSGRALDIAGSAKQGQHCHIWDKHGG